MKIRMLTAIAGSNFSHVAGDVVDWPDNASAIRLCEGGLAVPMSDGSIETSESEPDGETGDAGPEEPSETGEATEQGQATAEPPQARKSKRGK